jgi:hypothetical protein
MAGKCTKKRKSGRKAVERRDFLVHLEPGLIKGLKLEALQAEVTASSLLEAALQEWLDRGKTRDEGSEADGRTEEAISCENQRAADQGYQACRHGPACHGLVARGEGSCGMVDPQ